MATTPTLERLYPLRELQDANYGDRTTLMKRIPKADPFNARGTADRLRETEAALRFETGYIKRLREDRAAGLYGSRRHERMEHQRKKAAARAPEIGAPQRDRAYGE